MIYDRIKQLRVESGYSQSDIAKKLGISRSSVNAWEMGLSTPTTPYIIELSKLFHVTTDYLLGIESQKVVILDGYKQSEIEVLYNLIKYFDEQK